MNSVGKRWLYKIDIKQHMNRYEEEGITIHQLVEALQKELNNCHPFTQSDLPGKLSSCQTEDQVDDLLEDVYDFADRELVWLGL